MSINQFLKQLTTGDTVKDYQHASKLFVSDNYNLSPKYGFLYHVAFDFAPEITKTPTTQQMELGMLVKAVSLPSFKINTKKSNAYNRPNYSQTKVEYDDVRITFHDDSADVVRNFWYDYYSYFYRDSDYVENVYRAGHKYQPRSAQTFGYTPRDYPANIGQLQFINAIRIYSLHQKKFSEYTLINPIISSFKHGEHRSDANELMSHEMNISYETVKYATGYVTEESVKGFSTLHYDRNPSPLTPAGGGTNSIAGPGGLLDTANSVVTDLADGNIASALFKGGRALQNFKDTDLSAMAGAELTQIGKDILSGQNPLDRMNVPALSSLGGKLKSALPLGQAGLGGMDDNAAAQNAIATGGLSPNVTSNGSFLSSLSSFGSKLKDSLSNGLPSLPTTSAGTWDNPLGISKAVESGIRALHDPNAPPYTGTDPIIRARLGLPPVNELDDGDFS